MKSEPPIRKFRKKGWFRIDNDVYDTLANIIGWNATLVYFALARHVNKNQYCFPAQVTMADKLGISVSSVKRAIAILLSYNIVCRKRNGKRLSNGYWLLDKSVWRLPNLVIALPELSHTDNEKSVRTTVIAPTEPYSGSLRATNDTRHKNTHNNDLSNIKLKGKISVNLFVPKNNREQIVKDIAMELEEKHMDYLLSILRKHGIEIMQRALGLYRETRQTRTLVNPAAYFNRTISGLINGQAGGGHG